ncbi:Hsp20 family protein [Sulfurimonas aquatica]|uniref:Hsp20 family protein n=1 Tax=Sulfurimonas aquatica TaxID=2672570 RepID=A0A975GCA2_9BACT|nr:Hsp20/alpha crystallin family protein [Sulfurimonas aquatica]QSZ41078.1 Hsp20 family protein [Sulfurimonas aquatica]
MFITHYNPQRSIREFRRGFDLLNSMLDDYAPRSEGSNLNADFSPAINTREGEFAYHVEVDLPGIKKEDIDISVEDNRLIISGERKIKEEIKEENYYKVESSFGSFSRSFSLPEGVDIENIHAENEDGVLEVIVPKLEKSSVDKVKKITIK